VIARRANIFRSVAGRQGESAHRALGSGDCPPLAKLSRTGASSPRFNAAVCLSFAAARALGNMLVDALHIAFVGKAAKGDARPQGESSAGRNVVAAICPSPEDSRPS